MPDEPIFHITTRAAWRDAEASGSYTAPSLDAEGFIHCSTRTQVVETANLFYRGQNDLVLLCIDPSKLTAPLRYEAPADAAQRPDAGRFPHVYGPLNLDAVTSVVPLPPSADGSFVLPAALRGRAGQPDEARDHARPRIVTVRATNYDGSDHWVHPATLLHADDTLVMTRTSAGLDIARERGIFTSPYNTRAHYWTDRWFNAIRLELPGRGLYGYYCNIATPLEFDGSTVHYVDLQLDVIVTAQPNGSLRHRIADEDEFEEAIGRYAYTDELVARCWRAVDECIALVEARTFPFD